MLLKYTTGSVDAFPWICATAAAHTAFHECVLRRPFPLQLNMWGKPIGGGRNRVQAGRGTNILIQNHKNEFAHVFGTHQTSLFWAKKLIFWNCSSKVYTCLFCFSLMTFLNLFISLPAWPYSKGCPYWVSSNLFDIFLLLPRGNEQKKNHIYDIYTFFCCTRRCHRTPRRRLQRRTRHRPRAISYSLA